MKNFEPYLCILFASLFASIVFLLIVTFSDAGKTKSRRMRWAGALSCWGDQIFFFEFSVFILVFATLAIIRFETFHTGYHGLDTSWDLGLFDQAVWNSLHGRLLENSFIVDAPNYLGKSFSPILMGFVPLYAIFPSPIVLLVVQTFAIALVAVPLYWQARNQLGRPWALVIASAFFLYPGAQNMTLNEFHDIALEAPLLAFAVFFLLRRRYAPFLVCLGVGLLVKEEVAIIGLGLALYVLLVQRNRKLGIALFSFFILAAVVLLQFIIPYFRGAEYGADFYYFGSGQTGGGGGRYAYLGNNLPDIILTLLTRPDLVVSKLADPLKLKYLFDLLIPLAFLPLVGIESSALALPTLGYSLLSTYPLQYSIKFYYFAPILPFLFFGAMLGLQRVPAWARQMNWVRDSVARQFALNASLAVLVLASSVSSYAFQSPGPLGGEFQAWRYQFTDHTLLGNQLLALIPSRQTVIAQNEYLAHLSHTAKIYEVPIPDYRDVEYVFADSKDGWYKVHTGHWDYVRGTGFFETLADQDGYWVARRIVPQQDFQINFRDELTALGYTLPATNSLKGGTVIHPIVFWRAEKSLAIRYGMRISVVDAQNHLWAEQDVEPHGGTLPTNRWERAKIIADQYALRLPPTMPAGEYQIVVGVHPIEEENFLEASDPARATLGNQPTLARVRIEKDKESIIASDLVKQQPLVEYFVDMREMRLLGYYPIPSSARAGELLPIGLYWRARSKPQGDYRVSVQLRDANGRVVAEHSSRPANGAYPTTNWDAGEVLLDWQDLNLSQDLLSGEYQIVASLYGEDQSQSLGEARLAFVTIVR